MGKGARAKTKKRLNSAKRAKYMEGIDLYIFIVIGLPTLEDLARRQADPNYSAQCHKLPPPNAFVHPADPNAMFPQKTRTKLIDMRSTAVEGARKAQVASCILSHDAFHNKVQTQPAF